MILNRQFIKPERDFLNQSTNRFPSMNTSKHIFWISLKFCKSPYSSSNSEVNLSDKLSFWAFKKKQFYDKRN